ncbi:Sua5/YciO/YrdC/YwlC family protein [Serratia marcescens]|uniref:Sua5/YciO/YrdC/YwlC family protein n=1 Tax=Serratia marcescens TaxID=615 RepID=A0A379ZE03_SERMA|nr:Sua5/YciO/YrdC/YwlC family protein [Serratia marcescens]
MCRDLSELSTYAHVDNTAFRLIKNNTPGHYTFSSESDQRSAAPPDE